MQDSQEKKQRKILQRKVDFTVALSVVVAAFALFSIASFGIINNQKDTVSYAAPAEGFDAVVLAPDEGVMGLVGYGGTDADPEGLNVPLYYMNSANSANRVFCVELRKTIEGGEKYTKNGIANDAGLLYILKNTMANKKTFTEYKGDYAEYVEVWATQAAIWLYLAEKYPSVEIYQFYGKDDANAPHLTDDPDSMVLDTKNGLLTTTKIQFHGGEHSGDFISIPGVAAKVRDLVDQAKKATGAATPTLTLSASDQLTKTADGKFYQTSLINVTGTPADALKSYDISSVTGIDGVRIVDENGKELALKNIAAGKKFYVRIPVNKVTEKTQTVKVLVDGYFTMPVGVYYTAENSQKLILLDEEEKPDQKGIDFDIVGVPDTGMNAAQTIYFIGLIVLLCGVGIVYANTKPVESKQ